ncbi:helix-turn-helix transcriptional regulator [Halomonas sp. MCCC 1A17488]|uniref:Helix-turn-helix transcriptional regulator n=1 Tax=Billgrantia sulfidoxydans TaxID=2733484 RepID=A0ABX7W5Y4_9GAMM|nr:MULTISPECIES: AraC family transcriptional regulator [Halomonas]MCE8014515.1 helix-turn-helix transcriptional regulator [Halomonas sp. MCCC 1A17488]MCG3237848.1 helix-turn-helix transcriptional regulator [Halomonas sp. MCCC 1A17488]QPP48358.1 helix-turn-helix domain-containing protein [Halomonas sp. SS10-MC5]QTP55668.1 helix-turn-helix transcriptional regulator [Halomonas sulfidoxydans]
MPSVIRQTPLDTATQHHAHDFHQIVIGLQGRAEFEIEGLGGAISALSGCIVPANHVHYYMGQGENRQLILDLPANAPSLTGYHHELSRLFDAPRFFALDKPLKHYLDFLLLEQASGQASLNTAQSDRLAATFLGCLHARLGGETPQPSMRRLDLVKLDHFIDSHLSSPITVADLAAQACLSEAHFRSRFREQTGLSPWQYVRRRRLEAARQLLAESRMPLSQIALHTGFAHQSALSHAFRSAYGCPPSQLRRAQPDSATALASNRLQHTT